MTAEELAEREAVITRGLATFIAVGQALLDIRFLGSGTTAIVAERIGYRWLGIEIEERFVELARRRIARAREA